MPGTIQISVSDIVDPPLSSSTSMRVTMGRREYQATDNGDISIPLTSLREKLVIKLINSNGHEISQTSVETRLVVEKGAWDEIFQTEEGGKIHLKMQFFLSEEEQSRIRMMRLSALKKKHGDLVNDTSNGLDKTAASVGGSGSAASSQSRGTMVARHKAEASVSGADDSEVLCEEGKLSPPRAAAVGFRSEDKKVFSSKSSASSVVTASAKTSLVSDSSAKVKQDAARNMETKGFLDKNPSNVRKMISAFETGLTQEKRPRIKPPPTKQKTSKPETEVLMSSHLSKERADERSAKVGLIDSSQIQHPAIDRAEEIESAGISRRVPGTEACGEKRSWKAKNFALNGEAKLSSYPSEGSREWMFLDEPSKFCVTTAGKKMMHLMEGQSMERGNCREKRHTAIPSTPEKQAGALGKSNTGMNGRGQEIASMNRQRKPQPGHSADAEPSNGPFGQIMKIGIMVGFGALVFFTRQGKNR